MDCSSDQKRQLIEPANESISVRRQCELIGLPRASLYYEPQSESPENLTLMRLMGLEAIYPKPRLSLSAPGHQVYPYLLRGVKIDRVNQVWSTDITHIRLHAGFIYLVAVIDWHSRYVLSWEISTTMETTFA